eukprot:1037997-Karenia_brevis.AAC.1
MKPVKRDGVVVQNSKEGTSMPMNRANNEDVHAQNVADLQSDPTGNGGEHAIPSEVEEDRQSDEDVRAPCAAEPESDSAREEGEDGDSEGEDVDLAADNSESYPSLD